MKLEDINNFNSECFDGEIPKKPTLLKRIKNKELTEFQEITSESGKIDYKIAILLGVIGLTAIIGLYKGCNYIRHEVLPLISEIYSPDLR